MGLHVGEFWDLTPRETVATFEAAAHRQERERERDTWLAWHVAALSRAKRLPSLKELLQPARGKTPTPEEMALRRTEHAQMVERMRLRHAGRH